MIHVVQNAIRTKRQYVAALIANLAIACMGASMAWTSPVESKLKTLGESPLAMIPTSTELSWIGSILTLGSLTGPAFAGLIAYRFGRKLALLTSAAFYLIAYVLFLTATSVAQILAGRFIQGCGIGFAITITPMYVAEIATDNRRGALGSLVQTYITLGILFDYVVGPYVSYTAFQWIQMSLPVPRYPHALDVSTKTCCATLLIAALTMFQQSSRARPFPAAQFRAIVLNLRLRQAASVARDCNVAGVDTESCSLRKDLDAS